MNVEAHVTPWPESSSPTEIAIRRRLDAEELNACLWANGPGDTYAPHVHSYNKVIYVVSGDITFGLVDRHSELTLGPGDRLDLPAGVKHDARVGPQGVVCLEAHS